MMNLGNTCYMNSFMQAMFMTKKFRSTILDMRDEQSIPSSKTLFYALSNLFSEMLTKTIGIDSEVIP
jgi:ubiquitin C-terminal hydrolase